VWWGRCISHTSVFLPIVMVINSLFSSDSVMESNFTVTVSLPLSVNQTTPSDLSSQIWIYGGIPTLIFGILGHVLAVIVLTARRKSRYTPANVYLIALSAAGSALLIVGLLQIVVSSTVPRDPFRGITDAGCKVHVGLTYFILHYCAWIQATIAVDRLLFVVIPLRYKLLVTWRRSIIILLSEFIFLMAIDGIYMHYVELKDNVCQEKERLTSYHTPLAYLDLTLYSLLPGSVMAACYVVIIVMYSRRQWSHGKLSRRREKLGAMFVALNIIFLATSLPSCIIWVYLQTDHNLSSSTEQQLSTTGWALSGLLTYIGSACTFIVYCVTGSQFRLTLLRLCGCRKRPIYRSTLRTSSTVFRYSPSQQAKF